MKRPPLSVLRIAAISGALATAVPGQTPPPAAPAADLRNLFRDALFEEEASRDLTKAADTYEKLLAQWDSQRPTAAAALYRLAEVRRKQDRQADAIALYQRLLREFPDVEPHAKLARENLAALGVKEAAAPPAGDTPGASLLTAEETTALQRAKKLAAESPDLLSAELLPEACYRGWSEVVRYILSKGGKDNPDGDGLIGAVEAGHLSVVKELMKLKPDAAVLAKAVDRAVLENRIAVLKFLLESGGSPEGSDPNNPLLSAAAEKAAELLLAHKANPDPENAIFSPLFTAASRGHTGLVQRLLELKADPNRGTRASFNWGNHDPEKNLLMGPPGSTPLHAAVFSGNTEIIKHLLDAKANPDAQNDAGWTPLRGAVEKENLPLVEQLLAAGADPNLASKERETRTRLGNSKPPENFLTDSPGSTPLHAAVSSGNAEIIKRLLDAKANPDAQNDAGWTPLRGAVEKENLPLVEQLLAAGADPNLANKLNETPLLKAVESRARDIAAALLKAKADPNALIGPEKERTAMLGLFGIKDEAEREAWLKLFLEHGADPFAGEVSAILNATGALRLRLYRSHKYPALAALPAISLAHPDQDLTRFLQKRKSYGESPGSLPALLMAWNHEGGWKPAGGKRALIALPSPDWSTLRLWRKGADGKMQETVIEVKKETAWPELQWGDVIEVLASEERPGASGLSGFNAAPEGLPPETLELLKSAK